MANRSASSLQEYAGEGESSQSLICSFEWTQRPKKSKCARKHIRGKRRQMQQACRSFERKIRVHDKSSRVPECATSSAWQAAIKISAKSRGHTYKSTECGVNFWKLWFALEVISRLILVTTTYSMLTFYSKLTTQLVNCRSQHWYTMFYTQWSLP